MSLRNLAIEDPVNDDVRLKRLGYKEEFLRTFTSWSNLGASVSLISVPASVAVLLGYGLSTGGPVVLIWGWPVVAFFSLLVSISLAEIASAYPVTGGLYFWAGVLGGPTWGPFFSWMTAWYNLLGFIAGTASLDFGLASFIASFFEIAVGFEITTEKIFAIYAGVLVVHACMNAFLNFLLPYFDLISIWWHIVGTATLIIILGVKSPKLQDESYHLTFVNYSGWGNWGYVMICGLLVSQFTIAGFDASIALLEETKKAAISGPVGIVSGVIVSFLYGWAFIWIVVYSIQDYDGTLGSATGQPLAQIFLDNCGKDLALFLCIFIIGCMWACGLASVTTMSRVFWAFSRDGGLPFSSFWHNLHPKTKSPIRAIFVSCLISFIFAIPCLFNTVAFPAITSICTIALYLSYGLPILLRITIARSTFKPGPFNLGSLSLPIGFLSCLWISFITVLFCLPPVHPVTAETLNYAPVLVGSVFIFAFGWFVIDARRWFEGPVIVASIRKSLKTIPRQHSGKTAWVAEEPIDWVKNDEVEVEEIF